MIIRESGMPDVDYWESLFDAAAFLETLRFDSRLNDVAEFGCGYGTFALALARRIRGTVYAIDCDPTMLEITTRRAAEQGLQHIVSVERDLLSQGTGLPDRHLDGVLIAHLLHGEEEENLALLGEAHRILCPSGRLGVIHWRRDVETPRGPPLEMRPSQEECASWLNHSGFERNALEIHPLGPHHWGIVTR